MGTALRETTPGESKESIVQRMWNHAPRMWQGMDNRRIPWPRLAAEELADLLAFLTAGWSEDGPGQDPAGSH